MNRDRRRYWSAYIADVQGRMLLADWNVELRREPTTSPGAGATVETLPGRHEARIWVCDVFDDLTRAVQRYCVVHELLHLYLHPLAYHLEKQAAHIEHGERAAIEKGHHSHEEYAVDDLARIIAPSMPLPPKVAKP